MQYPTLAAQLVAFKNADLALRDQLIQSGQQASVDGGLLDLFIPNAGWDGTFANPNLSLPHFPRQRHDLQLQAFHLP